MDMGSVRKIDIDHEMQLCQEQYLVVVGVLLDLRVP